MMSRFGAAICGVAMIVGCWPVATTETEIASATWVHDLCSELRLSVVARRSWLAPLAVIALELDERNAAPVGGTIIGTASTYNPYKPGYRSGGPETASGELYDPTAWAAAVQIDLREMFGGIGYGKSYRPAYALVESGDKQVIVKINDVGPLKPDRIIDFNEQTMRYFDPTLDRGLIPAVRVTPLPVDDCTPGPIDDSVVIAAWDPSR